MFPVILVLVESVNAAVVMLVLEVPQLAMKKHVLQLELLFEKCETEHI